MPLPRDARQIRQQVDDVGGRLEALPATPLEADLPEIVDIVKDLKEIVNTISIILSTTRIN
jgi:hypothetical protein